MDAAALRRLRAAFDPDRFREQGHALVDRLADYLGDAVARRSAAVLPWQEPEHQLARTPGVGEAPSATVDALTEDLLRRALHLHDPRAMGHQDGLPLPAAALAGLFISLLNNDPSVYETGPTVVPIEVRLIEWMCEEAGLPKGAGGILTSGGSLGNLTSLLAARQAVAGYDLWTEGARPDEKLCVLVSDHAHYCVARAVKMMGWGEGGFLRVPVDEAYRMRVDALPAALDEARRLGRRPIAVVASACTTATGSFDPLDPIADFCERQGLWFHVDGAHGASVVLSPRYRHLLRGLGRADSLVWDCHKMMLTPAVLTGVLFKERRRSYETFRQEATYLFDERPDEEWYNPGNRTVECTRSGMALLLYTGLRVHGAGLYRDYVTRCLDVARRLAELVETSEDFELAMAPEANIVCFRYTGASGDPDDAQDRFRRAVTATGSYYLVSAELGGRLYLRCTLQNPFTDDEDLLGLLAAVREAAASDGAPLAEPAGGPR